jgi:hypothetical protein
LQDFAAKFGVIAWNVPMLYKDKTIMLALGNRPRILGAGCRAVLFAKRSQLGTAWDGIMSDQPRVVKVLAALLVSMTTGAMVLMALGSNPPSAGPFSLSSYFRVEKAILSDTRQSPDRWSRIEIYYSGTKAGNVEQLASLSGLPSPDDLNCHFVVCNGLGGSDGQIEPTEKWQRQWSIISGRNWHGSAQTIRVCVIGDGKTTCPTDCQLKGANALVEGLCRRFGIEVESVTYPDYWL